MGDRDNRIVADMPLVARRAEKGAKVVTSADRILDATSVGEAQATRNLSEHLREANQTQTYNAPFGPKDRSRFLQAMDRVSHLSD